MKVSIKLFAAAAQLAGGRSIDVDVASQATVADLRRCLIDRHPALAPMIKHAMIAVDHQYASDEARIDVAAEIALIPPVSGG